MQVPGRGPAGVRQQVRALVLALLLLVVSVGALGVLGVSSTTQTVRDVTDIAGPAEAANHAIQRDLSVMRTSIWEWAFSADESHLADYRSALAALPRHQRVLRELTADDAALHARVLRQERLADSWVDSYPRARLTTAPGERTLSSSRFEREHRLFDRLQVLNAEVEQALHQRIERAEAAAPRHLTRTAVTVALLAILGAGVALVLGRLLGVRISGPLVRLEAVVDGLAAGNSDARAVPEGPREIQRVATALNGYVEETQRIRATEHEVVAQLRDLDKAKTDFLSSVSHELRTPLTSITGYIEILADNLEDEPDPQRDAMLDVINRNVDRLRTLIEDLLVLSRAESDTFRTAFGPVDLTRVVTDVAHDMRTAAAERGLEIVLRLPQGTLEMRGDYGQLSRAVLNLVSNAVKFTCDGGRVDVSLREVDGTAVLEVADTGMGIPAAEIPRLATRFFRASNAVDAQITGTGLGLRIVQTIADNHAGRIEVDSTEGVGTTARLLLPLRTGSRVDGPPLALAVG